MLFDTMTDVRGGYGAQRFGGGGGSRPANDNGDEGAAMLGGAIVLALFGGIALAGWCVRCLFAWVIG